MPEWTAEQREVIESPAREIVCGAAAGSGKTAVLVERVFRMIREGEAPESFLIITFTNAAAAEMKDKIRARLMQGWADPTVHRALDRVNLMQISTIHSFCQRLLKNEFQVAGLDPLFRICDTAERESLFHQGFLSACETLRADPAEEEAFARFRETYTVKAAEGLVKKLYQFLMSLPNPWDWLEEKIRDIPSEVNPAHPWFRTIRAMAEEKLEGAGILLNRMYTLLQDPCALEAVRKIWKADSELFHVKQSWLQHPEGPVKKSAWADMRSLPRKITDLEADWKERYQEVRKRFRKIMDEVDELLGMDPELSLTEWNNIRANLTELSKLTEQTCRYYSLLKRKKSLVDFSDLEQEVRKRFRKIMDEVDELLGMDPELSLTEWNNIRANLTELSKLTEQTCRYYSLLKRKKSLVDFSDLEQEALRVLRDPACLEEVREDYRHIFVDECQDVSAVQDAIIQTLHSEKSDLFMVGDVKQSIYRFRLAEPTLFLERMRTFASSGRADQVFLPLRCNFRSRPEILETTNTVFRAIMHRSVTELDYTDQEALVPGRKTEGSEPVWVDILQNDPKEYPELSAIADHIAGQIGELRQRPCPGKERNYEYRDCVILMPAVRNKGALLADLLRMREIPVYFDGEGDFFEQPEILHSRCLLQVVQNEKQDLPLLAVLKEVPFVFTDQELAEIRLHDPGKDVPFWQAFLTCAEEDGELGKKCARALRVIHTWQNMSEYIRLSDFIWYLFHESGYYDVCGAEQDGPMRQANLRLLCSQAYDAEVNGIMTVRGFLKQIDERGAGGDQQTAAVLGEKDDLVRIMTIHKSKGLQFPVVFVAGLDQDPEGRDSAGIRIHPELGLTLPYKDPDHRISRATVADDIFRWRSGRDQRAEKVRLLYVAMTRAQEKLILISCAEQSPVYSMPAGDYRILAAKSYMDWVLPPLLESEKSTGCAQLANRWNIRVFDSNQQKIVEKQKDIHNLRGWLETVLSGPPVDKMWITDSPDRTNETLVKRSVTALVRSAREQLRDAEDLREETEETKRQPEAVHPRPHVLDIQELPAFMAESGRLTAAARGTLHHRMLSLLKLDPIRAAVSSGKRGAQALLRREIAEQKAEMTRQHLFSENEAGQVDDGRLARFFLSPLGRRMLAADEVHREWSFNYLREESSMILQGVIDCAFREGDAWVLLDYKTDYIEDGEAFVKEYTPQIGWYTRALEGLTGKPVKERYLYSLSLSRVFPVP